ncbi:furin-like prohormone convertase [Plakobranchus ocellatus]|uniref:Furin-like prohormone convertase n=1 Tax=Plakobranchus ocellatus TaxID=259542 RepID=A0AAV4CWE7_9GAST|nr:furin-like prohormone convertase [Plakobranchus ocellatus]
MSTWTSWGWEPSAHMDSLGLAVKGSPGQPDVGRIMSTCTSWESNSCLKCVSTCRECKDTPTFCTACHNGEKPSPDGSCKASPPGRNQWVTPKSHGPLMLVVALVILLTMMFIIVGAGVVYAYKNTLLCFMGQARYGIVPNDDDDEEDDGRVRLKYNDGLDDDYGA